jgi:hypothetical protein
MSEARRSCGAVSGPQRAAWVGEFDRVFRSQTRIESKKRRSAPARHLLKEMAYRAAPHRAFRARRAVRARSTIADSGTPRMNIPSILPRRPPFDDPVQRRRLRLVATVLARSSRRALRTIILAGFLMLTLVAVCAASLPAADSRSADWMVVTVARDGSWGVATAVTVGPAIAAAISRCRAMAATSDCGAQFVVTRGWALASLCGDHKIIAAANDFAEAEGAVRRRETDLRLHYAPDLPACRRFLTVAPGGVVILASAGNAPLSSA